MSVTLAQFPYPNTHGYDGSVSLRLFYTGCYGNQFIDSGNVAVPCGTAEGPFYIDIPVTVGGSTLQVAVGGISLYTTDDSNTTSVLASAQFWVNGAPRDFLFSNWIITHTLGASVTFAQLWLYNLQATPAYTMAAAYLTAPQVAALIAAAVGSLNTAAVGVLGRIETATVPVDPVHPKAVLTEDPRMSDTRIPTNGSVTPTKFATSASDPAATVLGARTMGTGRRQAASGADARFGYDALFNVSNGTSYWINSAYSADGETWQQDDTLGPLFSPVEAWEGTLIHAPCKVVVGDVHYVFYDGFDGANWSVGLRVSFDAGRTYIRFGKLINNASFPRVIYDAAEGNAAKRWKMVYTDTVTPDGEFLRYAYAANPLTSGGWTLVGTWLSPVGGTWENNGLVSAWFMRDEDGTYCVYYTGKAGTGATFPYLNGLATCANMEGAITRDAGNPIFNRKSTATQTLSADSMRGSQTVTVPSTAAFVVDEPVLLANNNSVNPQLNRIRSVDSATQFTLYYPVDMDYTGALTAKIRSLQYFSIEVGSVWRVGETFRAAVTGFQVFADLGTSPLIERTFFMDAPARNGPWTANFTLPVPVPQIPGSLQSHSGENFTVATVLPRTPVAADPNEISLTNLLSQAVVPTGSYGPISLNTIIEPSNGLMQDPTDATKVLILEAGVYDLHFVDMFFNADAGNGFKAAYFEKNGSVPLNVGQFVTPNAAVPSPVLAMHLYGVLLNVGDYLRVQVKQNSSVAITALTNANPAVATAAAHGLSSVYATLAGFAGSLGTALNAKAFPITVLTANTFSIPIDTTALSVYGGAGATVSGALFGNGTGSPRFTVRKRK